MILKYQRYTLNQLTINETQFISEYFIKNVKKKL